MLWTASIVAAACPKVVANDAADAMISDEASLKSGIALWKEIHRGIATTKGIAWQKEVPLQYRMAEFDNVCVNDSRYVAGNFLQAKAPTWPTDRHVTVEEIETTLLQLRVQEIEASRELL